MTVPTIQMVELTNEQLKTVLVDWMDSEGLSHPEGEPTVLSIFQSRIRPQDSDAIVTAVWSQSNDFASLAVINLTAVNVKDAVKHYLEENDNDVPTQMAVSIQSSSDVTGETVFVFSF